MDSQTAPRWNWSCYMCWRVPGLSGAFFLMSYLLTALLVKQQQGQRLLCEAAMLHIEMFYDDTGWQCNGKDSHHKTCVSACNCSPAHFMKRLCTLDSAAVQLFWVKQEQPEQKLRAERRLSCGRETGTVGEKIPQWKPPP